MVASLKAIKGTGAAAASYFAQVDDYYRGAESAPTAWVGKGAEALGLSGAVDGKAFTDLLAGKINGQQLGRVGQDGKIEHKPGWDMTFSAPKSVSIMALVADDHRLIDAHETAVRETLAWLEKEAAITRVKERGGETKVQATGNLIAATFRHATSRELQPQLHTHTVIVNATRREDGKWRSLES
ncbi:MAG: MobF family relaxase, partial [Bacillota bacterium]|nr:MobF family relaxase [Bacillota bacterium]